MNDVRDERVPIALSRGFDDRASNDRKERPPRPGGDVMATPRVRGPATARAVRSSRGCNLDFPMDGELVEDSLPSCLVNADFRTLQQAISREIEKAEGGAAHFDATVLDDDIELRRHKDETRQRREQEDAAKRSERAKVRQARRLAEEARQRQEEHDLRRKHEEHQWRKTRREQQKQQCRCEAAAAARIQAWVRGRRSRIGIHTHSPVVHASVHSKPWSSHMESFRATPGKQIDSYLE